VTGPGPGATVGASPLVQSVQGGGGRTAARAWVVGLAGWREQALVACRDCQYMAVQPSVRRPRRPGSRSTGVPRGSSVSCSMSGRGVERKWVKGRPAHLTGLPAGTLSDLPR